MLELLRSPTTLTTFSASYMTGLETQIDSKLKSIDLKFRNNKLSLNVAKTDFMVISSLQKMQSKLQDNKY